MRNVGKIRSTFPTFFNNEKGKKKLRLVLVFSPFDSYSQIQSISTNYM